ncbi:MAG: carbamoyltransferase, partial [Rhodobacteraceae bacterium]|nr:carbamoyltransferase [Paracoccaceae bacterium]
VETVVAIIAARGVVAWHQGRTEFGPRALGARSILADPRDDAIRKDINAKIKKRELFRPFAPSTTAEACGDFFEIAQASPYMNILAAVRPEKRAVIPAVTHVDGTARVHTVSRAANPLYHRLITAFGARTGVPVLLNTSFNIQEPIVNTPREAIRTFLASDMDLLAIGGFVCDRAWRTAADDIEAA